MTKAFVPKSNILIGKIGALLFIYYNNYNYRNKEKILSSKEYLDYICIIGNIFISSSIISLLLEEIKSPIFIVLIQFCCINKTCVVLEVHNFISMSLSSPIV